MYRTMYVQTGYMVANWIEFSSMQGRTETQFPRIADYIEHVWFWVGIVSQSQGIIPGCQHTFVGENVNTGFNSC